MARVTGTAGKSSFGSIFRQRPELWKGFSLYWGLLWEHSTLDPLTKDLCRLKSAFLNGCAL